MCDALSFRFGRNGGWGSIEESEIFNLRSRELGSGVVSGPRFELGKGTISCEKAAPRTGGWHYFPIAKQELILPQKQALAVSYRAGAVVGHVMEKGTGWDLGFWREDGRNTGKTKKEDAERGKSMGATGRRPDGEKTIHMLRGSFGRLQYRKLPSNGPQAALMLIKFRSAPM